ncbi:glycoside hydrolase family 43 protein [Aureobasidium subglaciale]|nr:glycoside hydrolase family 43 protein [Aureobasidium subglaciale]
MTLFQASLGLIWIVLLQPSYTAPLSQRRSQSGPHITTDFPDPSILRVGDVWYAFAGQSLYDYKSSHIQLATSTDFETWTLQPGNDMLPDLPSWVDASKKHVWAPDVNHLDDGRFLLYFSAPTFDTNAPHCIGTAISDSIDGPYVPSEESFACPADQGGAIDAAGFRDADGTRYVVYKIDANSLGSGGSCNNGVEPVVSTPIVIQEVETDGVSKKGDTYQLITNDSPEDGPLVEGPSLIHSGDTYYLFYSSNCFTTTKYDVAYATSSSPTSGFTKQGTLFDTGYGGLKGPGGADAAFDNNHFAFAAQKGDGRRSLYTAFISPKGDSVSA